ncbi:MAG: type II toxin-antitoxin system VapC family toxin [Mycobacteriales bacterium]
MSRNAFSSPIPFGLPLPTPRSRCAGCCRCGVAAQDLAAVKSDFARDWDSLAVVALDETTCKLAADLAETTGARTLDALHLAAASRAGAPVVRLVTFDARLAQVARSLGWSVVGA